MRFLGYVADEDQPALYSAARCGLPLALRGLRPAGARGDGLRRAGRLLDASSIPEVAGDAALTFDPDDELGLRRGARARAAGRRAARRPARARAGPGGEFTWEKTAAATIQAYRDALEL